MSCQFPLKAMAKLLPGVFRSRDEQHPYVVHYLQKAGKLFVEKMFLMIVRLRSRMVRSEHATPQSDQLQKVPKLL